MSETLTREAAQTRLVEKALADPSFRAALLDDPRKVITEEFGTPIPANITIEVLEETPRHYYVVLPSLQDAAADEELDDEALDAVSGGIAQIACDGKV